MRRESIGRPRAFTLVEMLTVIAIITLLIGILVPSLSAARATAQRAAIKAQINSISAGCEMFRNDENEYPKSNEWLFDNQGTAAIDERTNWEVIGLSGAHLIVDAMVGRDFLGYDPRPGTGPGAGVDSRWSTSPGAPPATFPRSRRNAYVPPEGISFSTQEKPPQDGFGTIANGDLTFTMPEIDASDVRCPVFVDKFGFPILYYRANPRSTQSMPIIQTTAAPLANIGDGVYDGRDNAVFTSDTAGTRPANFDHRIADANTNGYDYPGGLAALDNNFAEFIRSFRATSYVPSTNPPEILFPRPVQSERFILLSPGKDGIWGNLDDVANFEVLSEER